MIESAAIFYHLRTSLNPLEYHRAAHEEASESVWKQIIVQYPDMRSWVAHNKTVPISILEILAQDEDGRVRHMVALKRKLPEHLQMRLAQDVDEGVRRAIASNARATLQALELLSRDDVEEIRQVSGLRLAAGLYGRKGQDALAPP